MCSVQIRGWKCTTLTDLKHYHCVEQTERLKGNYWLYKPCQMTSWLSLSSLILLFCKGRGNCEICKTESEMFCVCVCVVVSVFLLCPFPRHTATSLFFSNVERFWFSHTVCLKLNNYVFCVIFTYQQSYNADL